MSVVADGYGRRYIFCAACVADLLRLYIIRNHAGMGATIPAPSSWLRHKPHVDHRWDGACKEGRQSGSWRGSHRVRCKLILRPTLHSQSAPPI